jgi:large subunit ribosomal protein L9
MKVLLKEDVDNLGYAGEVMDVADGYGRNYLIPNGLAVKASSSVLKQAEVWRERATIRMNELRKEHQTLASKIEGTNLVFEARAGETGKLYGSVTTAEIAEQLNEVLGIEIDRRNIASDPIRQLGEHQITVRLSRDYSPSVNVFVHPFSEEEDEEVIEAEAAEETVEEAGEEESPEEVTGETEVMEPVDETSEIFEQVTEEESVEEEA